MIAARRVINAGFCLVLAILVGGALVTYANFRTIAEGNGRVDHARQVVAGLQRTLSVLKDAETGQRGYLLTGKDRYLGPYRAADDEVDKTLDRLEALTTDDPRQRAGIAELRRLAADKMAELRQTVALRDQKGTDAALEVVQSDRGVGIMDRARRVVADLEGEEDRLLTQRAAATQDAIRRASTSFVVAIVVALALLLAVSYLNRRVGIQRERAAESIRHSESWLSTTLTSIGDAVIATDGEGHVRFLNPIAETMTGWTQGEAAGRPLEEVFVIVNETTRQPVESPVGRVIREGVIVGLANHTIVIARDGTETAIEDSAAPIKDRDGGVIGVVMVFQDATQRRRHEAALRESEGRFRQMAESMSHLAWIARPDGHIFWYNKRWYEYTGTTPDQMEGWGWQSVHDPEVLPGVLGRWKGSIATGEPFDMVFPLKGADDEFRPFLTRVVPLKDDEGRVVQWFGTNTDISDERRHEAALRRGEEENARLMAVSEKQRRIYEAALSSTPDFNYVFDLEGRFTYANEALLNLWRKGPDEALGRRFIELDYPPDLAGRLHGQVRQVIETKQPVRDETPYTSHLGERQYEYIFVPVLGAGGAVEAVAGSTRDITERKRVEYEVRAARDEAEHANQAKDRFLAVLSHELRTPLNPILLAATSMLEKPPEPEEVRSTLEMIRQNVMLQSRLIDDLLDVMRIVRGKMPLHWEVADCHSLIRQSIQICQSEVFGKELRLQIDLGAQDHFLNADPARFQQVIWNLVKNAVKFTPGGGTITIRTRNEDDEGVEHLVIEVSDTGIGIGPGVLPVIFDPFQQGETKITRKFGGLGLGLAICRGIVESHGGTLTAESPGEGRGTTFRISLKTIPSPAATNGEPNRSEPAAIPTAPQALKLLIVEDEPATLRLMARLMKGLGHEVTTASTTATALAAVEAVEFDLIVSDIGLPDGSGLDLMRRVVALRGPVPAIALTGYGMEEDIQRSRDAGFTAHLTKPIDFMKLEAMIRRVAPVVA